RPKVAVDRSGCPAVGVSVDDPRDDVGQVALRIDTVEMAGFDQRGDDSPVLGATAPPSEPAKRAFWRPSAIGRIERSTTLESISMRPLSMKLVSPFHRESS